VVLVECGTRALVAAAFGPDTLGETGYARRLLPCLGPGVLLLADAYYDDATFLAAISDTGAQWLVRSGVGKRRPVLQQRLADGSYLAWLATGRTRHAGRIQVRILEAQISICYTDGTVRAHAWRLMTSLLDERRYPAQALLRLYHERWEIETSYYSIKHTLLDGRVLRSHQASDIDQEVWAILAVYQAIRRLGHDALATHPEHDPDRVSFTTALHTARTQVILAAGINCPATGILIGAIGRAVLANLLPNRRQRTKARTKKIAESKYKVAGTFFPAHTLHYTLTTHITLLEEALTPEPNP
jgi:hypothetical protein